MAVADGGMSGDVRWGDCGGRLKLCRTRPAREGNRCVNSGLQRKADPSGQIDVPPEIASQVPRGEEVRVMLLWDSTADDREWGAAGSARFESAYCPEDAVYEELIHDSSAR
jgi:hypothetical protein